MHFERPLSHRMEIGLDHILDTRSLDIHFKRPLPRRIDIELDPLMIVYVLRTSAHILGHPF